MIVTLITKDRIYSISLPERVSGQYWLSDTDGQGHPRKVLNAEGLEDAWVLQSGEFLTLLDENGRTAESVRLAPEETRVISAVDRVTGERSQIYAEPDTRGRQTFRKYCLQGDCDLSLGRTPDNQIVFENKYVSAHHARLICKGGAWSVVDTQSSNGTFVNGQRTALAQLKPGDVVFVMGLKILIGGMFFAVNDPDGTVRVTTGAVTPFRRQEPEAPAEQSLPAQEEPFCRSPRFCRSITAEDIRVDAPPNRERMEEVPLALLLGPALTMGITSLVMGAVAVSNYLAGTSTLSSVIPTLVMSLSMLCGTVLWPMLTKRHEKKKKNAAEHLRQAKYREYLDSVRDRLGRLSARQAEILAENSPDVQECTQRIVRRERRLWERAPEHEDFLRLRLGLGELPLAVNLRFPDQRFVLEDDYLMHDLARLQDEPKVLKNVPVTLSLLEDPVCGILGQREKALAMTRSLLLQMAALHSPEDVKLVVLTGEEELPDWDFARWLPHIWDDTKSSRFFAAGEQEARALSAQLEPVLAERTESLSRQRGRMAPRYVIVMTDRKLTEKNAFFTQALSAPAEAGFSCICVAQALQDLPRECSRVVELEGEDACVYARGELSGQRLVFRPETAEGIDETAAAKSLSNLVPDGGSEHYQLPDMLSFLEMYGVGKVEHLNALTRWQENNPVNSLQVPVGVGTDGELFTLDLHEKFHGPHGLVAGMTGSGKSEFIITYILSGAELQPGGSGLHPHRLQGRRSGRRL